MKSAGMDRSSHIAVTIFLSLMMIPIYLLMGVKFYDAFFDGQISLRGIIYYRTSQPHFFWSELAFAVAVFLLVAFAHAKLLVGCFKKDNDE